MTHAPFALSSFQKFKKVIIYSFETLVSVIFGQTPQRFCQNKSEESRYHKVDVSEILRYALDDKSGGNSIRHTLVFP